MCHRLGQPWRQFCVFELSDMGFSNALPKASTTNSTKFGPPLDNNMTKLHTPSPCGLWQHCALCWNRAAAPTLKKRALHVELL